VARTNQKTVGVRRVKTKEERKRPGVFTRLKQGEHFKAVALFEPDPEREDNFGYFEYYDHYDERANTYVPCTGDACPFCEANKNPSTRGLTLWYFPEEKDDKEKLKLFTMNFSTINDATDEAEDEGGMLGRTVRIKRMDDRGDYKVRILDDKALTKKEIKALLKEAEEHFKEGLEGVVDRQLRAQLERLKALDALEDDDDDDDDDEEPKGKARKGKAISDDDDDDDDEDEEEEDDEEEDDDDEDENEEEDEDEDDDEDEDSDEDESDDDEEDDDDEDDEDEDEDEEATEIKGGVYEVVSVNEKEETFNLKNDDGKVKMWLGVDVDVDYDAVKKGATVTVDALADDEGDFVVTKIAEKKKRGRPKGSGSKGKKGKGKK
jgi:hypothetical protein